MEAKMFNPVSLAFLGDSVYEIMVRRKLLVEHGSLSANKLHRLAVGFVKASAQASAFGAIEAILTEEEIEIFKRGRNSSSVTVPKSCTAQDYRTATGVEALFGYLYLCGRIERIQELFNLLTGASDVDEKQSQVIL